MQQSSRKVTGMLFNSVEARMFRGCLCSAYRIWVMALWALWQRLFKGYLRQESLFKPM